MKRQGHKKTPGAWGGAVDRSGGSTDAFYSSVDALGKKVREATKPGGGEARSVLWKLGISPQEDGQIKSTTAILDELAGSMHGMTDYQADTLGEKLGLDTGTIRLLQQGRKEVDTLIARQKELGVYTAKDAAIAQKTNNSFKDMGQALQSVAAVFMRIAAPAIGFFAEILTSIAVWIRKNEPFVLAFFAGVAAMVTTIALPAITALTASFAAMAAPFAPLIAIIAGIALVIDDLVTYIEGGESALGDLWSVFGTGEEIAEALGKAWEMLQEIASRLISFLLSGLKTIFQVFGNVISVVVNLFRWFERLINLDFAGMAVFGEAIMGSIGDIIAAIGRLIAKFWDIFGMGDILRNGFQAAADGIISAWETVKAWFQQLFGWILDTWNNVSAIPGKIADTVTGLPGKAADAVSSGLDSVKDFFGFGSSEKPEAAAAGGTSNVSRTMTIGELTVNTQATDAEGIANGMDSALRNRVNQADGAFA